MPYRDPFDAQGADDRVRRDFWLLGLLFVPDALELAASGSWGAFGALLLHQLRNLALAVVVIIALCFAQTMLGLTQATLNVGNLIPQPLAFGTAAAAFGGEAIRGDSYGFLHEDFGFTPPQATALAQGAYEGCPQPERDPAHKEADPVRPSGTPRSARR